MLVIDDRQSADFRTRQGTSWRLVTDQVMDGISDGQATIDETDGRPCIRLHGLVHLENRGGVPLDVSQLQRIGPVAIGRVFSGDLCIGHLALYRELEDPGP